MHSPVVRAMRSRLSGMKAAVLGLASVRLDIIEGSVLLNRERATYVAAAKAFRRENEIRRAVAEALFSKTA